MRFIYSVDLNGSVSWHLNAKQALLCATDLSQRYHEPFPIYIRRHIPKKGSSLSLAVAFLNDERGEWCEEQQIISIIWPSNEDANYLEDTIAAHIPTNEQQNELQKQRVLKRGEPVLGCKQ